MEWLDLVGPSAAIFGLFAAIGLIIVAVRQGRAIRRLEERLAREGDAATPAPLQRIAELQARQRVSEGTPSYERQIRTALVVGATILALVAAIAGIWFLVARGGDGDSGGAQAAEGTTPTTATAPAPPDPVESAEVPDQVPPVSDPGAFTVAVFNASGVTGAARIQVRPIIEGEGYDIGLVENPPDGAQLDASVVMWARGAGNRRAAWNVAELLGVDRAPLLDGYTTEQVGGADVIVLVGTDLANGNLSP